MHTSFFYPVIVIIELVLLYYLSRSFVNYLYSILISIVKSKSIVYITIAIFFLPGTFIHELAHYITAKLLLLKVTQFTIIPEWKHNSLKLGHVINERKDFVRGILVGIAPVFLGLFVLYLVCYLFPLPAPDLTENILLLYFVFTVSSMMFSSKQDITDFIYVIPVIIFGILIVYFFQLNLQNVFSSLSSYLLTLNPYLNTLTIMLGVSIGINLTGIILFKLLQQLFNRI